MSLNASTSQPTSDVPSLNRPVQLDPFNLVALSEDIDNECERIIARELPKVTDDAALRALKAELRDQFFSLFMEMLNEWRHLAQETGETSIFDEHWIIPTVRDMANQLPHIYSQPSDVSPDAHKAWHIQRVQWTISTWLQLWHSIFAYVPTAEDENTTTEIETPELSLNLAIRPLHIYAAQRIWQMLRVLTLEYLARKADLLIVLGQSQITVNVEEESSSALYEAKDAFWRKRADAPILLNLAVRYALIDKLDVTAALRKLHSHMPTSVLLAFASEAGLSLPFPVELMGKMLLDLERHQDIGDRLELSYLYPVFRILTQAVEVLERQNKDPQVIERAEVIFANILQKQICHGNHSPD